MSRRQSQPPVKQRQGSQLRQLQEINSQVFEQNQRIKNIHKVALSAQTTTNNIGLSLKQQREVIDKNINMNNQTKTLIKQADKKTNQMLRRNICIKLILWILAILLFLTNIALIIWKAKTQ